MEDFLIVIPSPFEFHLMLRFLKHITICDKVGASFTFTSGAAPVFIDVARNNQMVLCYFWHSITNSGTAWTADGLYKRIDTVDVQATKQPQAVDAFGTD